MQTGKGKETDKIYLSLMEEIKTRSIILQNTIYDSRTLERIRLEFCSLQMRMIIETLALGCLVAHKDFLPNAPKRLQKEWSAQAIIQKLSELHPSFFPEPVKIERDSGQLIVSHVIENRIEKARLLSFYGQCGSHLHRGSLRSALSPKRNYQKDLKNIEDWMFRLMRLLEKHQVPLADEATSLLVSMTNDPKTGAAAMLRAERLPNDYPA